MRYSGLTSFLLLIVIAILFVSCQKEVDAGILGRTGGDTTAKVTPMFRVVDIDMTSPAQDSIIWIFKTVTKGTTKNVIQSGVNPAFPLDTFNYVYSYDAAGKLTNIKGSHSLAPSVIETESKFTWSSGRLTRIQIDTLGALESAIDLAYSPSGANTLVTPTYTPSFDLIQLPTYSYRVKHQFTVNSGFQLVAEKFTSHTYLFQGGVPQNVHDTADNIISYTSGDMASSVFYSSRHDTSGPGGSVINIERDTSTYTYSRSSGGGNFADSLVKIYGNEIYTLISTGILFDPTLITDFGFSDSKGLFYKKPLSGLLVSKRSWINGVFDPGSFSNLLYKQQTNTLDSQQRLLRCDIYADFSTTLLENILKFTY